MPAHDVPNYRGNSKPRRKRTHCREGHDLEQHGYTSLNGDDKPFTRCRLCHVKRVREYRVARGRTS